MHTRTLRSGAKRDYYTWIKIEGIRRRLRLPRTTFCLALGYHPSAYTYWRQTQQVLTTILRGAKMLETSGFRADGANGRPKYRMLRESTTYDFSSMRLGETREFHAETPKRIARAAYIHGTRTGRKYSVRTSKPDTIRVTLKSIPTGDAAIWQSPLT